MWTLRQALDTLPPGLDGTYSRILEKVNDHEKPRVHLMLQWLCFSFRPLRVEELADIFHVGDAIGPPFNDDAVVFRPEDVLDVCPGLLSLTTIEVNWNGHDEVWQCFRPWTRLQIAQLAHFSVKEYLLQSPQCPTWLPLNQELAYLSILKSSMAYFISVAAKLRDDTQSRYMTWHELAISHSLAIYCGQYTQSHLLALSHGQREHPDLLESFRCLLNPHSRFTAQGFTPIYLVRSPWPNSAIGAGRMPAVGMSLLIAAKLGLTKMVECLLSFGRDNCTEDDDVKCDINFIYMDGIWCCGPALAEASAEGHIDTVKLLLGNQYRAQLYVDRGCPNALCIAAGRGHENIVQLLIDAGADANPLWPTAGGPLHAASRCGNVNIVHMLLAHGADLNAIIHGETLLQTATYWGQAEIVRVLIDAGADVNLVTRYKPEPPLQFAVKKGSTDLVRMLLDAKADIGAVSGNGNTALGIAAAHGHEEIVKLLLDLRANNITKQMKTAALAKAKEYHHTITALLLAAGADAVGAGKIRMNSRTRKQKQLFKGLPDWRSRTGRWKGGSSRGGLNHTWRG
jgi:ankyrin repeat protein